MAGRDRFFWPGLAHIGVSSLGGVLFQYKCLGLMNARGPVFRIHESEGSFHGS